MDDGLKLFFGRGMGKHMRAHAVTVQGALRVNEFSTKDLGDLRHGQSVWRGDVACDGIGIDHGRATLREEFANGTFAAANAPRQADSKYRCRRM